jgi:hypothetical protein
VFAVKAVNKAGLESIGYSDGIILDSKAPYIATLVVYPDAERSSKLQGYVAAKDIIGNSVYVGIDAGDQSTCVSGGKIQAYTIDSTGKRESFGSEIAMDQKNYRTKISLGNGPTAGGLVV